MGGQVAPVRPERLLRLGAGGARGFWASGDRWIAHLGVVETVSVESDDPGSDGARFRRVQDRAADVFSRCGEARPGARLFGGFSFSPRPNGDSVWSCFPAALFHLPEVELEHHPADEVCSLVVRARGRRAAEAAWRRWAAALEGGQAAPRGSNGGRPGRGEDRAGGASRPSGGGQVRGGVVAPGPREPRGAERAAWGRMVWRALRTIGDGEAEKVVLARTMDVAPRCPVPPLELVTALWEENHGSHVFLFEPVPGRAVVGAAPERLATLAGGVFRATAVAGSLGVGGDSVETAELARRLFDSEKDRAEHDVVVRDMLARLAALGCTVRRDVEPHVLALARIQHLETKIAAEVPEGTTLLDLLASLHPTPAVCGTPREVALSVLEGSEPFDRGWYAGPVGWFDSEGSGIFVPALRSAVASGAGWRLFAGAGIVAGSEPSLEWEETELKFRPVLRALARAGAVESSAAGSG